LLLACAVALVLAPLVLHQRGAAAGRRLLGAPAIPAVVQPRIVRRGNTQPKQVALTFDDGPHPFATQKLLSVLRAHDVKATFFVVGKRAKLYPELIRMEIDDGHVVANHSMSHPNLLKMPPQEAAEEIAACGRIIREITGTSPRFFRPPGGQFDDGIVRAASEQGYITVLWTENPRDYDRPGAAIIEDRVMEHIDSGAVILLHDGVYQTMEVLPRIITRLKRDGYRFVTLDELIQTGP